MPAVKDEEWHRLAGQLEALGVHVDQRWGKSRLLEKLALAEHVTELSQQEEQPMSEVEGAEMSVEEREQVRLGMMAKLRAMDPTIILHDDWTIEILKEKIEERQKSQLGRELAALGVPVDPKWSIERFQQEIEKARIPPNAPPGIHVVHLLAKEGDQVKVQCIIDKVHLGDGQVVTKMQKALVTAELADLLEQNEQCVRLEE